MVLSPLENGPKFPKDFQGNQKSFFLSSKVKSITLSLEKFLQSNSNSKIIKITKSNTVKKLLIDSLLWGKGPKHPNAVFVLFSTIPIDN